MTSQSPAPEASSGRPLAAAVPEPAQAAQPASAGDAPEAREGIPAEQFSPPVPAVSRAPAASIEGQPDEPLEHAEAAEPAPQSTLSGAGSGAVVGTQSVSEVATQSESDPAPTSRSAAESRSVAESVSAAVSAAADALRPAAEESAPAPDSIPASEAAPEPESASAFAPGDLHDADEHLDRLTDTFFSTPADLPAPVSWEEHSLPHTPMSVGARRAMYATAAIFGLSVVGMLGYIGYHRLVMPVPVELGEAAQLPPAIPQPLVAPKAPAGSVMSAVEEARTEVAAADPQGEQAVAMPGAVEGQPDPGTQGAADQGANAAADLGANAEGDVEAKAAVPAPEGMQPESAQEGSVAAAVQEAQEAPAERAEVGDSVEEAPVPASGSAIPDDSGFASMMKTADTLSRRGRNKEALEAYHRALSHWPDAPQALSRIAYLHLNLGDNARARQFAARAVEIDPTNSEGWIVLGAALEALRDRPGALAAYKKCASLGTGSYVVECRRLAR